MLITDIEENGGSVYGSLDAAQIRREETLQYVTYSLGFKVPESYNVPTSALVVGFESIGNSLCKAFTVGKYHEVDQIAPQLPC